MAPQKKLIYSFFSSRKRLLLVYDAARADYMARMMRVYVEHGLRIERAMCCLSAGSCTKEWLENTFTKPINAVYVTGNPWFKRVLNEGRVFKKTVDLSPWFWDGKKLTVKPQAINLVALRYVRNGENVIAHYMQPHAPFLGREIPGARTVVEMYRSATRSSKARRLFIEGYGENLRLVIEHSIPLIRGALKRGYRVAVTADHGELLGLGSPRHVLRYMKRQRPFRFCINLAKYLVGEYRIVDHPCGWHDVPELVIVPWIELGLG